MSDAETYDYVIVGAGSAGCVLANRLTASGQHRVLLIEAGPRDTNPWIHVPLGYGKHFTNPKVNWLYQTADEPHCDNRNIIQPRGKVLGGSSAVNVMAYTRGHPGDYDRWAKDGAAGWSFDVARAVDTVASSAALILVNPHNPTGRVQRRDELEPMLTAAASSSTLVIADEVHADLTHPGTHHIPAASLHPDTVTVTSATKSHNLAGIRCAVTHVGSEPVWEQLTSDVEQAVIGLLPDPLVRHVVSELEPALAVALLVRLDPDRRQHCLSLLDPQAGERVGDFFCGIGNFSLAIARRGAQVSGLEGSAALVERAQSNAQHNRLESVCDFHAADLFKVDAQQWQRLGRFDKVLIDPPRDGALELVKAIGSAPPARVVYVSCNAATLARDAAVMVHANGYTLRAAGVVNMFPHTSHVEWIAVFEK